MGQNTVNFTLSFQDELETEKLVRSGGKLDPLEKELRIASVNQYGNLMTTDPNTKVTVPKQWDFRVDKQGKIDPKLSSGKPDEIHSICSLPTFIDELIVASRVSEIIREHVVVFQAFVS